MMTRILNGACLCGEVRVTVETDATDVRECHCSQCRRQAGHVWAFLTVPQDEVTWSGTAPAIYRHSPKADRGFCTTCGSSLFWRESGSDSIDISAGMLQAPTGLRLIEPAHPGSAGDYYDVHGLQPAGRAPA